MVRSVCKVGDKWRDEIANPDLYDSTSINIHILWRMLYVDSPINIFF